MIFKNETGAIVGADGDVISIVDGNPGMVQFPEMLLYRIHKENPGYIRLLAHTHPPGMTDLSREDFTTLKAQALWFHPYPIRMSTVTIVSSGEFLETRYLGFYEAKETWELRGKNDTRKFEVIKEFQRDCKTGFYMPSYQRLLIERSYERE